MHSGLTARARRTLSLCATCSVPQRGEWRPHTTGSAQVSADARPVAGDAARLAQCAVRRVQNLPGNPVWTVFYHAVLEKIAEASRPPPRLPHAATAGMMRSCASAARDRQPGRAERTPAMAAERRGARSARITASYSTLSSTCSAYGPPHLGWHDIVARVERHYRTALLPVEPAVISCADLGSRRNAQLAAARALLMASARGPAPGIAGRLDAGHRRQLRPQCRSGSRTLARCASACRHRRVRNGAFHPGDYSWQASDAG